MTGQGGEWKVIVTEVRLPQGELLVDFKFKYESAMWYGWLKLPTHSQGSLMQTHSLESEMWLFPHTRNAGKVLLEYRGHFWNFTSLVMFCLGNSRIFLGHFLKIVDTITGVPHFPQLCPSPPRPPSLLSPRCCLCPWAMYICTYLLC